ncbi:MAG: hypothetical protein N3B01_06870 [Verrucomicrobiae bacterium]|nr:hypothetical protein [Verrucomicrobiae bacterium]
MKQNPSFRIFGLCAAMVLAGFTASAQQGRGYIGFVYPAGGQQGTTFQIRIGGQSLEGISGVYVSGKGVTAKIIEYHWPLSPQDARLLNEQLADLRRQGKLRSPDVTNLVARIEYRLRNYVQQPACRSISALVYAEVTIAPDAPPGERELRVITPRGPSNPLAFYVGQLPEHTRPAMRTCPKQVLGKEERALRNRPADQAEVQITLPCTLNGQIASREVNTYRFHARKGQRLVIQMLARQLIPYIADAVPGWFQPVMALYDARGNELAYDDDYRFKPDPVILYEVKEDGEYVLAVHDSIYRGREDFVYRISIGELPFVTGVFPLGGHLGEKPSVKLKGWNLSGAEILWPSEQPNEGIGTIVAKCKERISNPIPFAWDTLPEVFDREANNSIARAQKVTLPVIINGRIEKPDEWDVFEFAGKAGDTIVAEVMARRLDSPLDSVLKLTDAKGRVIAFSDDCEDLGSGLNTHHADSYLMVKLPADGRYYVHIGDTSRHGGEEYAYRLRLSAPRPDFALRVVPSSVGIARFGAAAFSRAGRSDSARSYGGFRGSGASVTVYVIRKDGFNAPIKLGLKDPPAGFTAQTTTLSPGQNTARFTITAQPSAPNTPVDLQIEGRAKVGDAEIVRIAVPAEDRMQAFLWRHLQPAKEFLAMVPPPYNPFAYKRPAPTLPSSASKAITAASTEGKSKFTKSQVAGRLRQLRRLYDDGYFTDEFYLAKVAECETGQ